MKNTKIFVPLVAVFLIIGVGFSGCLGDDDTFELTINIVGEGTVEVNGDEVESGWNETYEDGTEVNVEAIADEHWYFDEWTGDYEDEEREINITMDEDMEITAIFDTDETTYDLTVNIEGDGTVEVDDEEWEDGQTDTFIEDTELTLTADPADDWEFDEWEGTDETGESITITMDEDKEITARFVDDDEEPDEETYWNAYDFESEVDVEGEAAQSFLAENDDEENKTLQQFTYEHTFVDEDGQHMNFTIETTYNGITETEITVVRYEIHDYDYSETEESFKLQTYELEHNISVDIEDDDTHPDWIDMTVHIPVGNFSTEDVDTPDNDFIDIPDVSNFWIYAKAEFSDSNDNQGMFSYYLTEDMKEEMDEDDDVYYVPYVEDDFDDTHYDEWVLYGIYGHCWTWFQPFAEDTAIEEGTYNLHGFDFYVENTTVELSGYIFDGFHIGSNDITFGDDELHLKGTFIPSLPIPVYLRAGEEDGERSYEMELTEIVLG